MLILNKFSKVILVSSSQNKDVEMFKYDEDEDTENKIKKVPLEDDLKICLPFHTEKSIGSVFAGMTIIEYKFGEYGNVQKTTNGQESYTTPPLALCLSNLGDICFFYLFNIEYTHFYLKSSVNRNLKIGKLINNIYILI